MNEMKHVVVGGRGGVGWRGGFPLNILLMSSLWGMAGAPRISLNASYVPSSTQGIEGGTKWTR
jgi:hypothetical protein